ncbi:protein of unknown function [Tardiphaga sp. OK245]|jgi:hypothetical protein|nr:MULTISPECIES: DUF2019 domain-containing protein [unclassified Tardiphaga]SEI09185.1 protein of unknown function [Tardiphaga sp. OK245]SNT59503.1 protein of unknown function [Tardiphaga sp. OK246]
MKRIALTEMSTADLVKSFAEIVVAQDEASLGGQIEKFNRLFDNMMDVSNELKRRKGDQRILLLDLFKHPNVQVRLQAAKLTLAVAPGQARAQLEEIVQLQWFPQSGDAGMSLRNLDLGVFKPV